MNLSYIVIDDSELDCFVAKKLILQNKADAAIQIYNSAAEALNDIAASTKANEPGKLIVLLVDLMMPQMNGFQFIEAFERLPFEVQHKYFLVAVTSSVNKIDIEKLKNYDSVKLRIEKPLIGEKLHSLIDIASKSE